MRSLLLTLVLSLAAVGCAAGADEASTCALDPHATYTITLADGSPVCAEASSCVTLDSVLGGCDVRADNTWALSCTGERLTYTCGDTTITYTVLDASEAGYTVELANPAIADSAETLHVVEGGTR